ncbi:MAG TPA: Rrf2 family transcriptional regulator [Bacteroidota bacterium]|jgi:Rrf2 family protein|nr:Rrf2 family transcriptional regulator [Bacteroidota bacterium]
MFQLSKRVEYGLIAVRHMAMCPAGTIVTTKEIAEKYHLPYELLAKVMQKLAREKFISSYQGVHGGYTLARNAEELKVSDVINVIEGKSAVTIIQCESESPQNCIIHTTCTIKNPLVKLQGTINRVLNDLTIMEMV